MLTASVPVAALTPDHLRGVARVRASDPRRPGFTARFNLRPGQAAEAGGGELEVAIDCDRLDEELAALRAVIAVAIRREG